MRDILILFVHLIVTAIRVMQPGGVRSIVAESVLLRHQLLVLKRPRQRAPDLRPVDRIVAGLCAEFMRLARLLRAAIVLRPATIMQFHRSPALIAAIVETKRRNPGFGYQRIADQISLGFNVQIDKDTVRRVLAKHHRPDPGPGGPSWLSFLGHSRDSLWNTDLFRCESLLLNSHWVMVVMDQCTRRIIGFAVHI